VRVARDLIGVKEFNKLRGKAISLHSQVIKDFGKQFGVDTKQVQGLIRLAKKNGEKLGFLAWGRHDDIFHSLLTGDPFSTIASIIETAADDVLRIDAQ
jgi:hypothetical protein